jgi:hypothetical protein
VISVRRELETDHHTSGTERRLPRRFRSTLRPPTTPPRQRPRPKILHARLPRPRHSPPLSPRNTHRPSLLHAHKSTSTDSRLWGPSTVHKIAAAAPERLATVDGKAYRFRLYHDLVQPHWRTTSPSAEDGNLVLRAPVTGTLYC